MKFVKRLFAILILGIGIILFSNHPAQAQYFIRGDVNCDGVVDFSDVFFLDSLMNHGGPVPSCLDAADVNDDGLALSIADLTYLLRALDSGFALPPPFPDCGTDPTFDGYTCNISCCTPTCTLTTQCNDGIDNDGDGLIDLADPHCHNDSCDYVESCPDPSLPGDCCYKAGDVTGDYKWTLTDIVALVNIVYKGAAKPDPLCRSDCNDSGGNPTLVDIIFLVGTVFKGGTHPYQTGVCCL